MNPYAHLYKKVKSLLQHEANLTPADKQMNEWVVTLQMAPDLKLLVGKGGVNTIFYKFGTGERKLCYPDEILEKLDRLARKKFWFYTADGTPFLTLNGALASPPSGYVIGVSDKPKKLYKATPSLSGIIWKSYEN